jgi:predicted small metal-binding protein
MKRIACGDLVPGCEFTAHAASVAEVLRVELEHARQAHGINVTPQFLQRARDRIEDVEVPAGAVRRQAARRG